jgi:hypothetical protein
MKIRFSLALSGLILAMPTVAMAYWAINRHQVLPVSQGVWEVVGRPGSGAQDYWCAFGDFATQTMRLSAGQRLYMWRGIGPSVNRSGYKAIQFSLEPPPGADTSTPITLSMDRPGDNLSRAAARQYCYSGRFADPWRLIP